jgi:plastocyanin
VSIIRVIPSLSVASVVVATVLSACGADGADLATSPLAPADVTETAGEDASDRSGQVAESPTPEPAGTATTIEVTTLDNTFVEEQLNVAVGTEVVWKNGGRNDHDIVPVDDEGWGVGTDGFRPGDAYSYVFTEPGEYPYYCTIHGTADVGMTGTIIVT